MDSWPNSTNNSDRGPLDDFLQTHGSTKGIAFLTALAVFSLVGIVGNSLALSVFCSRIKKPAKLTFKNRYNLFTFALAVSDLHVCAVRIPYEVLLVTRLVRDDSVCKTMGYISYAIVLFASLIHIGICVERYYAVCKPLSPFSLRQVRYIIGAIAVAAGVLSIPAAFAFTVRNPSKDEVVGCHYHRETIVGVCYNVTLFALMLGTVVAVLSIYGVIFRQIIRVTKADRSAETEARECGAAKDDVCCTWIATKICPSRAALKQRLTSSARIAVMFFAVTLGFFLSYVPYFLTGFKLVRRDIFLDDIRFITSCTNFIVYFVFNRRIRKETIKRLSFQEKGVSRIVLAGPTTTSLGLTSSLRPSDVQSVSRLK